MIWCKIVISILFIILGMAVVGEAAGVTGAHIQDKTINAEMYVSSAGSDRNPGTKARPFKTIAKATVMATTKSNKGIGIKIRIAPGVYRESIAVQSSTKKQTAPIIYEAVKSGTVIISGADKWIGGWIKSKDSGIYSHQWNASWGFGPDIWAADAVNAPNASMKPIVRRREMLFVNNVSQRQTLSDADLVPGSFCVQEDQKRILLYPSPGCTPNDADVEVAKRDVLFSVTGRNNIVLRGIVFTRSANYVTRGAVRFKQANNILVENCRFEWNNGDGVCLNECNDVTFRNVTSSHNGMSGLVYWHGKNLLFQELTTDYNNWRGAQGGFDYWATAGMKILRVHTVMIWNHSTKHNAASGLWIDWDNRNIVICKLRSEDNTKAGLLLEASQGPIKISDSEIRHNERGIYIASSAGVTITRCRIIGNHAQQIAIKGDYLNGRSPDDWETGKLYKTLPEHCSLSRNVIMAESTHQALFGLGDDPDDWASFGCFLKSLTADGNTYYHPSSAKAFVNSDGHTIDLQEWQQVTGQDNNSIWMQPK